MNINKALAAIVVGTTLVLGLAVHIAGPTQVVYEMNEDMRAHIAQKCPTFDHKAPTDEDRICAFDAGMEFIKQAPPTSVK